MTPDEIPAEVVAAAQMADAEWNRTRAPDGRNWGSVPVDQVRRLIAAGGAAERERNSPCQPWERCEEIDFSVESAPGAGGIVWIWLKCSACGNVQAAAQPNDLGHLTVVAQMHFERKHADLIREGGNG